MRRVYVALGWGLVAAILVLSLMPRPPQVELEGGDKLGHLAAYGVLMFWFCLLYTRLKVRGAYAAGFIVLGIGIEFAQGWTGYRSFEVADMVADTCGVLAGWAGAHWVRVKL